MRAGRWGRGPWRLAALGLALAALAGCVGFESPTPVPPRPTPTPPPTPTPTLAPSYCPAAQRLLDALTLDAVTRIRLESLLRAGDEETCRTVYNQLLGQGVPTLVPTSTPTPPQAPSPTPTPGGTAAPPSPTPSPSPTPTPGPVARWINVGGERFVDPKGYVWEADPFGAAQGGTPVPENGSLSYRLDVGADTDPVDGTVNDVLFLTGRIGLFAQGFTVPNGAYDVFLYLMDPANTGTGARLMDVYVEGALVYPGLDVLRVAGASYAAAEVALRGHVVADGRLDIALRSTLADEVVPLLSPDRRPILSALHLRTAGTAPAAPTPTPTPTPDPLSRESLLAQMARLSGSLDVLRAEVAALLLEHCGSPTTECTLPAGAVTTQYRNLVQAIADTTRELDEVTKTHWLLYGAP